MRIPKILLEDLHILIEKQDDPDRRNRMILIVRGRICVTVHIQHSSWFLAKSSSIRTSVERPLKSLFTVTCWFPKPLEIYHVSLYDSIVTFLLLIAAFRFSIFFPIFPLISICFLAFLGPCPQPSVPISSIYFVRLRVAINKRIISRNKDYCRN